MENSLIGYSGFVGSTLLSQSTFHHLFRSTNIREIDSQSYDTIVCAAAPAQKWIANRSPLLDRQNIDSLIAHLKTVTCNCFVLISTIDVFQVPIEVDEDTPVEEEGLHAYGLHRRMLEKFVENHFPRHLIIRLPGLVGPGLRKNVIFDLLNNNNLHSIDSRGIFQFYPMVNLWWDIQTALQKDLRLLHLIAEPICVKDVSELGFGKPFNQISAIQTANYDIWTRHAALFGVKGRYQYNRSETIQAIRAYAQSEPKTLPLKNGVSV